MEETFISGCEAKACELQDVFKYLYQSCLGPEHLVTDGAQALVRIRQEARRAGEDDLPGVELLGGDYFRLHLKLLDTGLSAETLCRLFMLSAEPRPEGKEELERALEALLAGAAAGRLSRPEAELAERVQAWRAAGLPAVHHSEAYRGSHRPAYRVVRREYLRLLPLLTAIDRRLAAGDGPLTLAIDGRCASGKTTLAAQLSRIYDCNVFHMDNFFLRPEQRTAERLAQPGENADHERFLSEVLLPLAAGRPFVYRPFSCASQTLEEPRCVTPRRLAVVEGSYALHPALEAQYGLKVFSDIAPAAQRERILRRNSPEAAARFFSAWIPLEEFYFSALHVRSRADMLL